MKSSAERSSYLTGLGNLRIEHSPEFPTRLAKRQRLTKHLIWRMEAEKHKKEPAAREMEDYKRIRSLTLRPER